jgi:hypothetical protein
MPPDMPHNVKYFFNFDVTFYHIVRDFMSPVITHFEF